MYLFFIFTDYDSTTIPTSVTIQPTSDHFCFNGDIINDLIALEGDEDFQLMLVNPSPSGVIITDDTTKINIVDDDGKMTGSFGKLYLLIR